MPYTMQIYDDEKTLIPYVGDYFVVSRPDRARDTHWGECVAVQLAPARDPKRTLTAKMVISKIVTEPYRILLYGESEDYYIIADPKFADRFEIGQEITYEPYGVNFGWYLHPA